MVCHRVFVTKHLSLISGNSLLIQMFLNDFFRLLLQTIEEKPTEASRLVGKVWFVLAPSRRLEKAKKKMVALPICGPD